MRISELVCLSLALLALPASPSAAPQLDSRFEDHEHLTALQLYKMGTNTFNAIKKTVGRFVELDVIVDIAREKPLVTIPIPDALKKDTASAPLPIKAHLIGGPGDRSSLRKGDQAKIEGIIVDEGYGAYMIYTYRVLKK